MKPSRTLLIIFTLFSTAINVNCQSPALHEIGDRIKAGDKQALFTIASYFDSSREIADHSGQEVFYYTKSEIARRIIKENCFFTANEIDIDDSTTETEFRNFLLKNISKIHFSTLANVFLITPLVNRPVRFEMRPLSTKRQAELQDKREDLLKADWVRQRKIDMLVKQMNPLALREIAAEYFKRRWTDDNYAFDGPQFIALMQLLTGVEIGVEDETREISWRYSDDFISDSRLNLLILFSKYYQQYTWDSSKSVFVNPSNKVRPLYAEDTLFDDLMNSNDSIALNAFIRLSTGDVKRIATMADGYLHHHEDLKVNYVLPIYPFPFLKQMAILTKYCKSNGFDYYGSTDLRQKIDSLRGDLSFKERFRLENDMIEKLSFNEITAIEYWALVYEKSWGLAYSAGRILDKFYSKNWHDLIKDKRSLDFYLKKATLFMRLGIIGACHNYLAKFKNSPDSILAILKADPTTDFDIQIQIKLILSHNKATASGSSNIMGQWTGDVNFVVDSLQKQFDELSTKNFYSSMEREYAINELVSKISYTQIGIALNNINKYHFRYSDDKDLMLVAKDGLVVDTKQRSGKKYSFLETDFGLYLCGDFGNSLVKSAFLERYAKLSEYDLYAFYLDDAGVFYKKQDGKIDYDKMYELLKYDVVKPFAGGGAGNQDGEVYSLIKLMELTFKTTLGFPPKRCNSAVRWYCDCTDRANAWMKYIEDHKLLQYLHAEPISFRNE